MYLYDETELDSVIITRNSFSPIGAGCKKYTWGVGLHDLMGLIGVQSVHQRIRLRVGLSTHMDKHNNKDIKCSNQVVIVHSGKFNI